MKEVYPDIFQITVKGFLSRLRPEVNVFVIAGPNGLVFDAGFGTRGVGRFVVSEIKKIEKLYCDSGREFKLERVMASHSHGDHYPGMVYLREKLGLKIIVTDKIGESISHRKKYRRKYERHQADEWYTSYGFLRTFFRKGTVLIVRFLFHMFFGFKFITDPDIILSDTGSITVNGATWQIIPAPGHALDHIHLYQKEAGLMFVGDNVLRGVTPWLGPPESDLKEYLNSLEAILNTDNLTMLLCGHGSPVTEPYKRVTRLRRYRLDRVDDLYDIVSGSGTEGITFNEMVDTVYMNESGFKKNLGSGWIAITLKHLEREGKIKWKFHGKKIRLYDAEEFKS